MYRCLSLLLLVFLAASCVKEGGLEKVEGPVTPYYLLNEGGHVPASHAGRTASSVLTPIAGTYSRTLREATQMDMPVYPRFIKTTDWLSRFHLMKAEAGRRSRESTWEPTGSPGL